MVTLAKAIDKLPGLKFRGLMGYFGNVWGPPEERRAEAEHVAQLVARGLAAFRAEGMPVEIVSGGSTPSAEFAHLIPGLTEIRPGTYVYNDLNTYYQGACALEDCAVRVVATVVSTAVPGRAIIDGGSKTFSSDLLGSGPKKRPRARDGSSRRAHHQIERGAWLPGHQASHSTSFTSAKL